MGRDLEKQTALTPLEWHTRYKHQSGWTVEIRNYLYRRASIQDARRVLEVGCGSGVICSGLHKRSQAEVVGLDIDLTILKLAKELNKSTNYINGDAILLPFTTQVFDAVVCHYFLLWIANPLAALKEMVRVCKPGSSILALAEPDYGGRIDHPPELVKLGKLQTESLEQQGADPQFGRKLSGWFHQAGLQNVECGILGNQGKGLASEADHSSEWKMLKHDLKEILSPVEMENYRVIDENAWKDGSRTLFIPTFYAYGKVK